MADRKTFRIPPVDTRDQRIHAIVQRLGSETPARKIGHAFLFSRMGPGYKGFAKRPPPGTGGKQGVGNKIGRGARCGNRLAFPYDISLSGGLRGGKAVHIQSGIANEHVKDRIRRLNGGSPKFDKESPCALRTDYPACPCPRLEHDGFCAGQTQPKRRRQSGNPCPYYRHAHRSSLSCVFVASKNSIISDPLPIYRAEMRSCFRSCPSPQVVSARIPRKTHRFPLPTC